MEGISQHFNRRTIILVGCIVAILIYGIVTSFILSNNSSKSPKEFVQSQLPNQLASPTPAEIETSMPSKNSSLTQTYKSSQYSLQYPVGWRVEALPVDSGIGTSFRGPESQQQEYAPGIDVEISSLSPLEIVNAKTILLSGLPGFSKTAMLFNGQFNATKIIATATVPSVFNPNARRTIKRTIIVFENKKRTYIISYSYLVDENTASVENTTAQVLSSFVIK